VPEVAQNFSFLGLLAFGAFGTGLTLKRKLKQKSLFTKENYDHDTNDKLSYNN
jgi:hypothetical protein